MKANNKNMKKLMKAASRLDDLLIHDVPNVMGVCIEPDRLNPSRMALCVMLNDPKSWSLVPKEFQGHKVVVKLIGTPKWLQA
jgi:hypothetical protein